MNTLEEIKPGLLALSNLIDGFKKAGNVDERTVANEVEREICTALDVVVSSGISRMLALMNAGRSHM